MTTTATNAGQLPTALAAINGFIRATAGDVPDPKSVSIVRTGYEPSVDMQFDNLDDLCNWAAYLQVPVRPRDVRPRYNSIHHHAEATWGPVNGKMVEFHMVYIESLPEPHVCSDECDPGNCEQAHEAEFSIPQDCETVEF